MTPYLLFGLDGVRYAVNAASVLEIIWLPELTAAEEAPSHIAGVLNLRGKIAPVMNLELRLGHSPRRYQLSDSVIVLQADDVVVGAIVSEVSDVVEIADAMIEPPPHYDGAPPVHAHFLTGIAKAGENIVMLLDVARLIHAAPQSAQITARPEQPYFCPEATPQEREVFHARAHNLLQAVEGREAADTVPLSVVRLGGELFGIELDAVREFCHLRRVTPIPCCPAHIAGNMNLRGDILTLTDIRAMLSLPANVPAAEVVAVESGDLRVGVRVDQVLEVIYVRAADIVPMPAALKQAAGEFCKGVARYGEGMVSILDLKRVLDREDLVVAEEA